MKAMIDSIASNVSALASQGEAAVAAKAPAAIQGTEVQASAPVQASAEREAAVSVELSTQAQAKLLKDQGMSVPLIAAQLGLDESTVDGYLNISPAS
jgi:hypothetical protein